MMNLLVLEFILNYHLLRYQKRSFIQETDVNALEDDREDSHLLITPNNTFFRRLFNLDNESQLTAQTSRMSRYLIVIICK